MTKQKLRDRFVTTTPLDLRTPELDLDYRPKQAPDILSAYSAAETDV
jgi:hypothetical protein